MHSGFDLIVNFSMNNCFDSNEILNGLNYPKWKDDLEYSLRISNIDLALHESKSLINAGSTLEQKELLAK